MGFTVELLLSQAEAAARETLRLVEKARLELQGPRVAKKLTYWCTPCQRAAQGWRGGKCRACGAELVGVKRGEELPARTAAATEGV